MEDTMIGVSRLATKKKWAYSFHSQLSLQIEKQLKNTYFTVTRIGNLVEEIADGLHGVRNYVDDGIVMLAVGNITEFGLDLSNQRMITLSEHERLKRSQVQYGDLLVTITGRLGTAFVYRSGKPANLSAHVARVKVKADMVNPYYLAAYLNSNLGKQLLNECSIGSIYPHINVNGLQNVRVVLPPHSIQDLIAQVMHNAYATRQETLAKAEQLLGGIKDYLFETLGISKHLPEGQQQFLIKQSQVSLQRWDVEYFEPNYTNTIKQIVQSKWKVKTLGEIVSILTDGQHGYLTQLPTGIPLLRTTNIFENEISLNDIRYIAPEVHAEIKRSQLRPGDVLLTTIGSIGVAAVVDDSLGEANINQNLVKLTPKPEVNPYYLALFLNSPMGRIQTERTASKSVVPIVNYSRLRKLLVPLPPRSMQDNIAQAMQDTYANVKRLRTQAETIVAEAKARVERMILGEEDVA